jgi:hypothetical protein
LAVAGGTAAGLLAAAIIFQKKENQKKNEKFSIIGGIINRPVAGKSTADT